MIFKMINYKALKESKIENYLGWIESYFRRVNVYTKYTQDPKYYDTKVSHVIKYQIKAKDILKWLKRELDKKDRRIAEAQNLIKEADTKWQRFEKENKEEIKRQALEELKDRVHSWEVAVAFLKKDGFEMFMDDYPNDCHIRDSAQRLVEYLEREGIEVKEEKEKLAEADALLKSLANEAAKIPGFSSEKKNLPLYIPESYWWWYIGDLAKDKEKEDA